MLSPTLKSDGGSRLLLGMSTHDWRPTTFIVFGQHHQGFKCHACHKRARCPHGCGLLEWIDTEWYCPKCGDEWPDAETFGNCEAKR